MHRTFKFSFILGLAILAFAGAEAFAQGGVVRGVVKLRQADGKLVPHKGATVQPYRVDIDSGAPSAATTNDKGEFSFTGFGPNQVYILVVSGEGISASVHTDIKGGMGLVEIEVLPGEGETYTEAQVRDSIKKTAGMSEADRKKAAEEYEKDKKRVEEANAKAKNINAIVNASLKDGESAFKAKNWDVAIAKFDEGINADPEFEGTAPVFYNYKGAALKERGFAAYLLSTKAGDNKAAELAKAKDDFLAAIEAFDKGLALVRSPKTKDAATLTNLPIHHRNLLASSVETYRLVVQTKADVAKATDGVAIFEEYFTVEKDAPSVLKARVVLGDILREAGESEGAIKAYRGVLESDPDNANALAGIGLSLFNVGVSEDSREKMQEGLNYMQQFADKAPDTHPLKQSVKDSVEYLKTEQKLTPQKAPARRRN